MLASVAAHGSVATAQPQCALALPRHTTPPDEAVLRGIVDRGHGLEAISAILQISTEEVLEHVVRLGLPTPHNQPMRTGSGQRAWRVSDYLPLIRHWTSGLHAANIGELLGRSAGSVWAKARWLGLPRRDRRAVRRSTVKEAHAPQSPPVPIPPPPSHAVLAEDGSAIEVTKRRGRNHMHWTPRLDGVLSNRWFAFQHPDDIAEAFGTSTTAILSRAHRIQLPKRDRSKLVSHYDPSVVAGNIAAASYVLRECKAIAGWRFWEKRNGPHISARGRRRNRALSSSYCDTYSIGGGVSAFGM